MVKCRKGMSFLSFAIGGVFLTYLLLFVIGLFIQQYTVRQCDIYVDTIARKLVVCESMEQAKEVARQCIESVSITGVSEMSVDVDYAIGYNAEVWQKGGYLTINVHANISTGLFMGDKPYDRWLMKMIERNEVFQIGTDENTEAEE